jgi:hypothetical protein
LGLRRLWIFQSSETCPSTTQINDLRSYMERRIQMNALALQSIGLILYFLGEIP